MFVRSRIARKPDAPASAPAPAPAAEGGTDNTTGGEPSAYQQMLSELRGEHQQTSRELKETRTQLDETSQTINRIKEAVGHKHEAPQKDPLGWYDDILDQAIQAEKEGRPIPLTVQIATQLAETQKVNSQLVDRLNKAESALKDASNPEHIANQNAFSQMDSVLQNMIEDYYGEFQPHIFEAVAGQISDEIKRLRQSEPKTWSQIRSNPRAQKAMVQNYIAKFVPPKAMGVLKEYHEARQPFTLQDAYEAFEEAKQIKDPGQRTQYMQLAREKILELKFSGAGRR